MVLLKYHGKAFTRALLTYQNRLKSEANKANEIMGAKIPQQNVLSDEEIRQEVSQIKSPFDTSTTAGKTGQAIGNTLGYLGLAKYLGGTPLSYGLASGVRSYGSGGDTGDIAVNTALGTGFSYLNRGITNVAGKAISNVIPATSTLSSAYNPVANVVKNAVAGGTGMYGAGGVTGTLRNAYNTIRNNMNPEENRTVDWRQPWWSPEALTNFVIGSITNAYSGTKADIQNAKTKAVNDLSNLEKDLNSLQSQFDNAVMGNDIATAQNISQQIQNKINSFGNNYYLGKNASELVDYLNNQWASHVMQSESLLRINQQQLGTTDYLRQKYNIQPQTNVSTRDMLSAKYNIPNLNIQTPTSQNMTQNNIQQQTTQPQNKKQNLVPNNSNIQGLEDYTEQDIKDMVADHIQDTTDAKINNITLRQENGNLQAVVESDTDLSEIEPLEVDGNKIDIVDSMVFEPRIEYEGQTNIDLDNPTVTAKTEQTTNNDIKQVKIDELPKQDNKVTPTKIVQKAEQTNKTVTQKEQVKNTGKIDDFGEKIGGARKDLWQGTSRHATKEVIHNYSIARDTVTEDGKDSTSYSVKFKGKTLQDGFKTEQEAQEFIDKFKDVLKSNSASVKEFTTKDSDGNPKTMYEVIITDPKTLKKRYTGKEFSSKEEAESYAIALSMYLSEHGKNLFRPTIQKIERTNPNLKNSTKVTGQEILDTFKFRAGEFGNWVSNAERQKFLNYGYDALQDLATALDILPEDLSYGGKMAIAFGARGKGFSGALAHFEPVKKVINMTRLKGAGSLAHEMGHGLDNYLSQLSGYDKDGLLSENERYNNLPNSVKEAFKALIDSIEYNISTNQEEIDKKNNIFEKRRLESLKYHLGYYDKLFDGKATRYKKIKGKYEQVPITVTEEQKKNYERIKDILISGKLDSKRDYSLENVRGSRDLKGVVTYSEPLETLRTMIKQLTGSKANDDTIYSLYRNGQQAQQVTEVRSKSAFSKAAEELDKATGRASPYFNKIAEKIARSFEAFVNDELKKKGIENTYLVHSVYNDNYALFNPYPVGEERKTIDKAWRNLIDTMKQEDIFHDSDSDMLAFEDRTEYNPDILKEENADYNSNDNTAPRVIESTGKLQGNKPNVVGNRVWEGFKKTGYIDLNGKKVTSGQDLAEYAQIFRSPLYETFRVIYLKGNSIVGQEAVSSKTPRKHYDYNRRFKSKNIL